MTTRNEYLDKATAAFAVSANSRHSYKDRYLGAMQAIAAATIALAEQLAITNNKRLAHIDSCLADIAGELEGR